MGGGQISLLETHKTHEKKLSKLSSEIISSFFLLLK